MLHRSAGARWLRLLPALSPAQPDPGEDAATALGAGDQRIALALYQAQATAGGSSSGNRGHRRTLAEIVSMGGRRRGWTLAFKQLKADGLVQEQTLGHVIARWGRRPDELA
jgi:hypothetical protein